MVQQHQQDNDSGEDFVNRLNVLRAGVLGANDGIVSTAGLVIGVAGATSDPTVILISGLAGLVAGALSMAGGEYVSVSTQKDTEQAEIAEEKYELKTDYAGEVDELAQIYQEKGLSAELAKEVAVQLMKKDALAVHAKEELNIDPRAYLNPWSAALGSLISYTLGALLPLLFITLVPVHLKVQMTFAGVMLALALTGYISAYLGHAKRFRAVVRNVVVGTLTMLVTYGIGNLFNL